MEELSAYLVANRYKDSVVKRRNATAEAAALVSVKTQSANDAYELARERQSKEAKAAQVVQGATMWAAWAKRNADEKRAAQARQAKLEKENQQKLSLSVRSRQRGLEAARQTLERDITRLDDIHMQGVEAVNASKLAVAQDLQKEAHMEAVEKKTHQVYKNAKPVADQKAAEERQATLEENTRNAIENMKLFAKKIETTRALERVQEAQVEVREQGIAQGQVFADAMKKRKQAAEVMNEKRLRAGTRAKSLGRELAKETQQ